jgi:hypothetical protein
MPRRVFTAVVAALTLAKLAGPALAEAGVTAVSNFSFLSSLGVNTHIDQGYDATKYIPALRYLGVRNIRDSRRNLEKTIMVHQQTGVRVALLTFDVEGTIAAARTLAQAGALLAIEGPNEPNNFPVTFRGKIGGGQSKSWLPVAALQQELYQKAKSDPLLAPYPVFHVSEGGAETDNVGLQYLTIPDYPNARLPFPPGTKLADYANVHNYVCGVRPGYVDNQAWQAADPVLNGNWDGLYKGYGRTWLRQFKGYRDDELLTLPRVTTETGWDAATPDEERVQGIVLLNTYLAQFKRGWRYTFIYELGDGEGGDGHQGLFRKDWTPKQGATFIHNLTTILADDKDVERSSAVNYSIADQPSTVHDLLMQKSSGQFDLAIWGERVQGTDKIKLNLGSVRKNVRVYDITEGTMPVQTLGETAVVDLNLSDHALVVEFE